MEGPGQATQNCEIVRFHAAVGNLHETKERVVFLGRQDIHIYIYIYTYIHIYIYMSMRPQARDKNGKRG